MSVENPGGPHGVSPQGVDIAANRAARKWSKKELFCRAVWETVGIAVFRFSPRPAWAFRRSLLRLFGARIGRDVHLFPSVRIAVPWNIYIRDQAAIGDGAILYSLGLITIGERSTVSQYAHLCAGSHDHRAPGFDLTKPPITIGDEAWICAGAYVGPGTTIGERTIVGARAVVTCSVPSDVICAGNPAKVIKKRVRVPR